MSSQLNLRVHAENGHTMSQAFFSHSTPTTPTFELLGFGFYELSDDLASPILIAFEWLIASGTQVAPWNPEGV